MAQANEPVVVESPQKSWVTRKSAAEPGRADVASDAMMAPANRNGAFNGGLIRDKCFGRQRFGLASVGTSSPLKIV